MAVADPDELECRLHDNDMKREPGANGLVMEAVVDMEDIVFLSYCNEFNCASMEEVWEN